MFYSFWSKELQWHIKWNIWWQKGKYALIPSGFFLFHLSVNVIWLWRVHKGLKMSTTERSIRDSRSASMSVSLLERDVGHPSCSIRLCFFHQSAFTGGHTQGQPSEPILQATSLPEGAVHIPANNTFEKEILFTCSSLKKLSMNWSQTQIQLMIYSRFIP